MDLTFLLGGREMNEHNKQRIVEHLHDPIVQVRIQQSFQQIRQEANVTMSVATALSGYSENQLRYWEEMNLLKPLRGAKGHRLYSFQELDKLAIIRELLNKGFSPADIPPDIDQLWKAITALNEQLQTSSEQQNGEELPTLQDKIAKLSINQHIEDGRNDLFWRYFVSQILHMSLLLISKDVPRTTLGLVLPLNTTLLPGSIKLIEELSELGPSLVAALGKSRSSQTFLSEEKLIFEYPTDFRLLPLTVMTEDQPEKAPSEPTLIYLQRRSKRLTLSSPVVETIQRLLKPIYEDAQCSYACFGPGIRDVLISSTDLQNDSDILLNGLVEMIIRLGGETAAGQPRWRFCCILMPKDSTLPLHQRSLVVRVQSKLAPHTLGETTATPDAATSSLSIRALQSGHIVYLPQISRTDTTTPFGKKDEGPVRSAIAMPIGGENGLAVAVLYIASDDVAAFSENDQRVLRILCAMAEEQLRKYFVRQQAVQKLADIITKPTLIDAFFKAFLSENDFIHDVEQLLEATQNERQESFIEQNIVMNSDTHANSREVARWCFSFISIDIDKQSSLANIYGDRVTRNLAHKIGLHIQELLRVAFKEYPQCHLYYIFADRFYILLKGFAPEHARTVAGRLKQALAGSYRLDALRTSVDYPLRPESMLELSNITVRLGVTSYEVTKLREILDQYPSEDAISEVRSIISSTLNKALDIGRDEGGNNIVAWDHENRRFVVL
jgi:DNA-binding transcriptional MerR regulator/GAF domain-containing protein